MSDWRQQAENFVSDMDYKYDLKVKQRQNALDTAEKRRKIPVNHHEKILREFWNTESLRPLHFLDEIAERYGVKSGAIERIKDNFYNTLPAEEYNEIVKKWHETFPDYRNYLMSEIHKQIDEEKQKLRNKKISEAQQTLSDQDAIFVYDYCMKHDRSREVLILLAEKFDVSPHKIKHTALGNHPALADRDFDKDWLEWEEKRFGTLILTSPNGDTYKFPTCNAARDFMDSICPNKISYGFVWGKFSNLEPNTPTKMHRRFWKGWIFERRMS